MKIILGWYKRFVTFLLSFVLDKVRKSMLLEKGSDFFLDEYIGAGNFALILLKFYF